MNAIAQLWEEKEAYSSILFNLGDSFYLYFLFGTELQKNMSVTIYVYIYTLSFSPYLWYLQHLHPLTTLTPLPFPFTLLQNEK